MTVDQQQRTLSAWGFIMWLLVTYIPGLRGAISYQAGRLANTTGDPTRSHL